VRNVSNSIGRAIVFRTEVIRNVTRFFWSNSFLSWEHLKGIAGFSMTGWLHTLRIQRLLYCKISLLSVLLVVDIGHSNLQTSYHPISYCGDFSKKESIWRIHEAWRNWNILLKSCCHHCSTNTSRCRTKHTQFEGWLFSRRRWKFSTTAENLLCKLL
jgi:hypothetical protein